MILLNIYFEKPRYNCDHAEEEQQEQDEIILLWRCPNALLQKYVSIYTSINTDIELRKTWKLCIHLNYLVIMDNKNTHFCDVTYNEHSDNT